MPGLTVPSLVEAAASAAVGGAVLALVTAAMASAARIDAEASRLAEEVFRARQLEHLVDRAVLTAGSGPKRPAPLSSLSPSSAVFTGDLDGNGTVDASSSETTALEVFQDGSMARLRVRLGRQPMTVLDAESSDARLLAFDASGRAAGAATASLVELVVAPRDEGGDGGMPLRFAIPARFLP